MTKEANFHYDIAQTMRYAVFVQQRLRDDYVTLSLLLQLP